MNEWQEIARIMSDPAAAGIVGGALAAILVQIWKKTVGLKSGEDAVTKRLAAFIASVIITLAGYLLAGSAWSLVSFIQALIIAWLAAGGVHANILKATQSPFTSRM